MAIYLKQGATLTEMTEQPYDAEGVLQQLLADHPNLLVGDQDGDPRKCWLLVQREIGIGDDADGSSRWSLDHLFLDEEGVPTLVEVKRSSDTRIRREVVGQMLDYAANAPSYWGVEKVRATFDATRRDAGIDPAEELAAHIGPDGNAERFWQDVAANLDTGRLRLVFVADDIPAELRRIVEFLNEQMTRTDVLAIEVRQYVASSSDLVTLVPRLIGQTEKARDTKRAASGRVYRRWSERDLIDTWRTVDPDGAGARMVKLYEFMRDRGARPSWGTGASPSVTMWLGERDDETLNPVAISLYSDSVAINFDFVRKRRAPEQVHRLAALMRTIPGVAMYLEGLEQQNWGMRPGMRPADVLGSDEALIAWQEAVDQASAPA